MDMKDVFGAGEEILDAVNDAARRQDYSGLSRSIRDTVNRTVDQVRQEFSNPADRYREVRYHNPADDYKNGYYKSSEEQERPFYQYHPQDSAHSGREQGSPGTQKAARSGGELVIQKPAGRIAGPVQLGLGIAGTVLFGVVTIIAGAVSAYLGGTGAAAVFPGILTGFCLWHIISGKRKINLVGRFKRYVSCLGGRSYVSIEELSGSTGCEPKLVVKDIKKMIKRGMFPQGKLDAQETTFMLTNEVYSQYLQAEQQKKQRQKEKEQADREARNRSKDIDASDYSPEVKKILQEGNDYILLVHKCNDEIPDEAMSGKLDRLENIMKRIFDQVKRQPERAESLRKFMNYYLPTTKKLLEAYIELDRQPEAGDNIRNTKKEIEESLDVINEGFERLLDGMFQDTAWDISSDISVMKTMMAQEGLTGK